MDLKNLYFCTLKTDDSLAQLVEHLPFKQRVPSSSLGRVTKTLTISNKNR